LEKEAVQTKGIIVPPKKGKLNGNPVVVNEGEMYCTCKRSLIELKGGLAT
jgi:hypothetical protein